MWSRRVTSLLCFFSFFCVSHIALSAPENRPIDVPEYERQPGVAGKITSVGSDTLANLMTFWSQEFKALYPQVGFQIQASGSSTAVTKCSSPARQGGSISRCPRYQCC